MNIGFIKLPATVSELLAVLSALKKDWPAAVISVKADPGETPSLSIDQPQS